MTNIVGNIIPNSHPEFISGGTPPFKAVRRFEGVRAIAMAGGCITTQIEE